MVMTGAHQLADLFLKQAARTKPEAALAEQEDDELLDSIINGENSESLILQSRLDTVMAKLDVLEAYLRLIMTRMDVKTE